MAERRMFARSVLESDDFVGLSAVCQSLYVRLSLAADDDGFVNSVSSAMLVCRAEKSDLEALVKTGFLLRFPNGLTVIRHWHVNNSIRADRYRPTRYQEEFAQLELDDNGGYRFIKKEEKVGNTPKNPWYPQYRIGEESSEKHSSAKESITARARARIPLTAEARGVLADLERRAATGDSLVTDDILRRAILRGDETMYAALSGMRGGLRVPVPPGD